MISQAVAVAAEQLYARSSCAPGPCILYPSEHIATNTFLLAVKRIASAIACFTFTLSLSSFSPATDASHPPPWLCCSPSPNTSTSLGLLQRTFAGKDGLREIEARRSAGGQPLPRAVLRPRRGSTSEACPCRCTPRLHQLPQGHRPLPARLIRAHPVCLRAVLPRPEPAASR